MTMTTSSTTNRNQPKKNALMLLSSAAALACMPSCNGFAGHGPALNRASSVSSATRSLNRRSRPDSPRQPTDLGSVMEAVELFYTTKPMEAAFMTCSVKASAADAIAQVRETNDTEEEDVPQHNWDPSVFTSQQIDEPTQSFDPLQIIKNPSAAMESVATMSADDMVIGPIKIPRNVGFLLYGGLYSGIGQHLIYQELYPHLFGDGKDLGTVATKIVFDQLVHGPFVCLPLSYVFKAAVYQDSIVDALKKYVSDVMNKGLLLKYWLVWTPFECVMYNYVPSYLIIPFISMISFFWLIVLSSVSNSEDMEEGAEAATVSQ